VWIQIDGVNTLSNSARRDSNGQEISIGPCEWESANEKTFRTIRTLRGGFRIAASCEARERTEGNVIVRKINRHLTIVFFFFRSKRHNDQPACYDAVSTNSTCPRSLQLSHKRWTLVVGLTAAGSYNSSPCHVYGRTAGRAHALVRSPVGGRRGLRLLRENTK